MGIFYKLIIISILLTGFSATYFSHSFIQDLSLKDAEQRFNSAANSRVSEIKEKLDDSQDSLLALKAFFDSSDNITKKDFADFSPALTKNNPHISILSWHLKTPTNSTPITFNYPTKYRHTNDYMAITLIDDNALSSTINLKSNFISMEPLNVQSKSNYISFTLPTFSQNEINHTGSLLMIIDLNNLITHATISLPLDPIVITIKNKEKTLAAFSPFVTPANTKKASTSNDLIMKNEIEVADGTLIIEMSSNIDLFSYNIYPNQLIIALGIISTLLFSYIIYISLKRHKGVIDLVEKKTDDLKQAQEVISTQAKHLESIEENKQRLAEIKSALKNNEMSLFYQPKVNMRTGKVFGAEGLIRWIHPTKGLIPPLDFIPITSGSELESLIGDWVIIQALQQLDDWLNRGIELELSVNVTSHYIQEDGFIKRLSTALNQFPIVNPRSLQLEIVESSQLGDYKKVGKVILECRDTLGVHMALDDFGTGYSSLTHLRNLPVKIIKIDQTFVRDMLDDPSDYAIVDGVIGLAGSFHRDVIAEGVETTAHGLMLLIAGCEQAQGYGIARPMPAEDFPAWLTQYTPNQDWILCGKEHRSIKENKVKIFELIINEWKNTLTNNIQSSPNEIRRWPIMDLKHTHCTDWLKRSLNTDIFERPWLDKLEKKHERLHAVADDLWNKYQNGQIDVAREGLKNLHTAYDDIRNILKEESPQVIESINQQA